MEERSGQAGGPASALCPQDSRAVLLNPPRGPFHVAVTPLGCGSPGRGLSPGLGLCGIRSEFSEF